MRTTQSRASLYVKSPTNVLRRNQRQERKMALMMMTIVIVFVTCNIFSSVVWILFFNFKEVCQVTIAYLWSTSLLLETLNSSVNVIIYAVFNKKFRILFSEMFCNCFRKKEQLKGPVRTSGRFTLGPILYGPVASPSPIPFGSSSTPSSLLANHLQERLCALLFKGQLISEVIFLT